MGNLFFYADGHFGHGNIIRFCNRPFQSIKEMDRALIEGWNSRVTPNDTVWHLGDFSFRGKDPEHYLKRLNGKIHLILGNHDKLSKVIHLKREEEPRFHSIENLHLLHHNKQEIVLCHYAMRVWNKSHHGSWHLYGHSHSTIEDKPWGKSMDVGVDNAYKILGQYVPFSFEEIKSILDKREIIRHHE